MPRVETESVEVGTKPTPICALGPTGLILQNLEGPPVTVGGEDIEAGHGLRLAVEDGWQPLPGGYAAAIGLNEAPVALVIHGVTESGTARIAYLRHDLPPS